MTELISKEAVGEIIAKFCERQAFTMTELIRAIDKLPIVNAEQKRGKWIMKDLYQGVCSECGFKQIGDRFNNTYLFKPGKYKFCPSCCSRMEGSE